MERRLIKIWVLERKIKLDWVAWRAEIGALADVAEGLVGTKPRRIGIKKGGSGK